MNGESPVINGNGEFSRDFTYIDNVIQANVLSMITENEEAINTVYNVAFGERNTLNDLIDCLKESLTVYDPKIKDIQIKYGPNRPGDIPHSLASIDKAKNLLNYNPQYSLKQGLQEAVKWYWNNL
jgi:UDP-N-acetylglucosamine 4-epimerase